MLESEGARCALFKAKQLNSNAEQRGSAGQQLLCLERERARRETGGLKGKREGRKRHQQKCVRGRIEKSRGNSSTFTLIPKCVGGKM